MTVQVVTVEVPSTVQVVQVDRSTGARGPQGAVGPQGAGGPTGPVGPSGQDAQTFTLRPAVADAASLPSSGNVSGDVRFADDSGRMHLWTGSAWEDRGVPLLFSPAGSGVEVVVPASGGAGRSIIVSGHGLSMVGEVTLIRQSTGRRVLADWWQSGADPSGPVIVDFTAATGAGEFRARLVGSVDLSLPAAAPVAFSVEQLSTDLGATSFFTAKDL